VTYLVLEYSHDIFLVLEIILVALETQCSFTLVSSLGLHGGAVGEAHRQWSPRFDFVQAWRID
jgi:hypothetical protein